MALSPNEVIAVAQSQAPATQEGSRSALVLGAGGRLGERILDQVLGQNVYEKVFAWSKGTLGTSLLKLISVDAPDALRADDVYCVVHQEEEVQSARSAAAYHTVAAEDVFALAQQVFAKGAQRFILVSPISAFSQPAALYQKLQNVSEMHLAEIRFQSLVIVRPSTWSLRDKQGNFMERLIRATLNQIVGSMAGNKHAPITSETIAQAVVKQAVTAPAGLTIVEPDQLIKTVDGIAKQAAEIAEVAVKATA